MGFAHCRYQAYTLGSAFYGIYFLVSYPMFFSVDEDARLGARYASSQWSLKVRSGPREGQRDRDEAASIDTLALTHTSTRTRVHVSLAIFTERSHFSKRCRTEGTQ